MKLRVCLLVLAVMTVSTAVQAQSVRIVFSSDRNEEDQYYDIWKMKEDGSNPTQVTNEEGDARNPSVSLDAKYTVYDLAGDLYLTSSGNDPVNLTGGSANPCADGHDCDDPDAGSDFGLPGDNFRIVFTSEYPYGSFSSSQIWMATVNVSQGTLSNLVQLTDLAQARNYQPAWSGNSHIVYTRRGASYNSTEICTVSIYNPPATPTCYFTPDVDDDDLVDLTPSCNSGGSVITWAREQENALGYYDIWRMDCDANMVCDDDNADNLTPDGTHQYDALNPSWSSSGTVIAFASNRPVPGDDPVQTDYEIWLMNASDGSGKVHRTNNTDEDAEPDYAPDLLP